MMRGKKEVVFVGMSGGVDSSVTAALLQERGFDVHGVFIKVWEPTDEATGEPLFPGVCTWREDRHDAMRVTAQLNIPFYTLDLENEYKREVVDYMVAEYRQGRVPNPDVMCNKQIKFGSFLEWAKKQGADYIATGHYARVKREAPNSKSKAQNYLLKGIDVNKDQSYFLWTLTQKQLARTLFPIGEFEKSRVREMAHAYGLTTAEKKDSQGLCFIGDIEMHEFLSRFIQPRKGDVLNESVEKVGEHDGAFFFTIGQRHGFTVENTSTHSRPHYVVDKNVVENTITVSPELKAGSHTKKEVALEQENWIIHPPENEKVYTGKIRYQHTGVPCTYNGNTLAFKEPQVVAAGQSIVLYDGNTCIGGGIIAS